MSKEFAAYDEDLALKLQEKYKLKPTTLRVWKHRQGIPLRYLEEGGWNPGEAAAKNQQERLRNCIGLKFINRAKLGLAPHRLHDFLNSPKKVRLTKEEAKPILDELKDLRRQLEVWYQKMNLIEFIRLRENPILKLSALIENPPLYNRIRQRQTDVLTEEEQSFLRQKLNEVFEVFKP